MRISIVGGTFDRKTGRKSSVVEAIKNSVRDTARGDVHYTNGGTIDDMVAAYNNAKDSDVVIWMANVSNDEKKMCLSDLKVGKNKILITSKRNNGEYTFAEISARSLKNRANLNIEIDTRLKKFSFRISDPLDNVYYIGVDIEKMVLRLLQEVVHLSGMERMPSVSLGEEVVYIDIDTTKKKVEKKGFFSRFLPSKDKMSMKGEDYIQDNKSMMLDEFIKKVKHYATNVFPRLINPSSDRFLGNASYRFRCESGFPSFKDDGYIYVSRRNMDKAKLNREDFVKCTLSEDKKTVLYYGDNKPSVDTPIQLALYEKLPNAVAMVHSHCYIKNAPFTSVHVPCGDMREVQLILDVIAQYNLWRCDTIAINLIGHGSITIHNSIIDSYSNYEWGYYRRPEMNGLIQSTQSLALEARNYTSEHQKYINY